MNYILPYAGSVIQVDPEYKNSSIAACLMIVKSVDHDKDVVQACVIIPEKDRSVQRWYEIPVSEVEVIGSAQWAPEEVNPSV